MLLLLLICVIYFVNGELVGPVTIMEDGKSVTRYVVSTWAGGASTSGSSITLKHGGNVQIASQDSGSYSPYMFVEYKLAGQTISFDVDLSQISCSCNAAFYLVTMPAIGSNGQPTGGDSGNYYCDANNVNGEKCWEMDIMEANKYVTQCTPHKCDQAPGQPTYTCDGGGCATNSHNVNGNGMCPDSSCTINTSQQFNYAITFGSSTYHVVLTQDGRTFQFDACSDSSYIASENTALEHGMVIIMSYWGSDWNTMSWLDGNTGCSGSCDTSGTVTFSNIVVSTGGGGDDDDDDDAPTTTSGNSGGTDIAIKNQASSQQYWVAFYLENINGISCSINSVKIKDSGSYNYWYSSTSDQWGYYAFNNNGNKFTLPISVQISTSAGKTVTLNNIIANFNSGATFTSKQSVSSLCNASPQPNTDEQTVIDNGGNNNSSNNEWPASNYAILFGIIGAVLLLTGAVIGVYCCRKRKNLNDSSNNENLLIEGETNQQPTKA